MNGEISSTEGVSKPRLVFLKKGQHGYGFNLHGEKGVFGQFISAVDEDSPASNAGLLIGDRVVEVNEFNVEGATHAEVVNKIKTNPNEVVLLVVDKTTDAYLKKIGRSVTRSLADIESPTVVEEKESVQENGETTNHQVVQDATDEDMLDAVKQVEDATAEIEESIPEPETELSPPEIEVPTPEIDKEVQESTSPETEDIHNSVGNGGIDAALPPPAQEPEQPTVEQTPVPQEPVSHPVSEQMPMKVEKNIPKRKQIKQQKIADWKAMKDAFESM